VSDTDPLATLLHKTANYCMGHKDPFSEQPDCDIIAARLRAAGVTLTQPQPDTAPKEDDRG